MMRHQIGEDGLDTQLWTHSFIFSQSIHQKCSFVRCPRGLDRYQRVMMKAFMKYIKERMQSGVLENDATVEELEQLL